MAHNQSYSEFAKSVADKPKTYTEFAKLYTHDQTIHNASQEPLRSGLTLLQQVGAMSFEETFDLSDDELDELEEVQRDLGIREAGQRARFLGFTTGEFQTLDALAPAEITFTDHILNDQPLHPLLERRKWNSPLPKHQARYPIRLGLDGYWEASNDRVWAVLEPCLRLASKFMTSAHVWPWWDALFAGKYEIIASDELPETHHTRTYRRFLRRQPPTVFDSSVIQDIFLSACEEVEFFLASGTMNAHTGTLRNGARACGETSSLDGEIVHCRIAQEMLEPLMDKRITVVERLCCRFHVVEVVVHEFTHAIWKAVVSKPFYEPGRFVNEPAEPFYEDEVLHELGWSMTNAVLGGMPESLLHLPKSKVAGERPAFNTPTAGILEFKFNTVVAAGLGGEPVLNNKPLDWNTIKVFPIPLQYFVEISSPEFWDFFVWRYGAESAHIGPKTIGNELVGKEMKSIQGSAFAEKQMILDEGKMSEDELVAARIENERRAHAKITVANWKVRAKKTAEALLPETPAVKQEEKDRIVADEEAIAWNSTVSTSSELLSLPSRYDEIREYLFRNRQSLALDTMYFDMGEHVLFAHIHREGSINLNPLEWRAFLRECNWMQELFSLEEMGAWTLPPKVTLGVIRRIEKGWPKDILTPRKYETPSDKLLVACERGSVWMAWRFQFHNDPPRLYDIDKDLFLAMMNRRPEILDLYPNGLNMNQLDSWIAAWNLVGERWGFGLKGIIRRLAKGWDDLKQKNQEIPIPKDPETKDEDSDDGWGFDDESNHGEAGDSSIT